MNNYMPKGEMDTFLEKCILPKLNEEGERLNRPIPADKIEAVIQTLPTQKKTRTRWLHRIILQII